MANDNKTRTIYNALKSIGSYKGSESEFNSYMYAPGAQGYNNRKSVYDTLVKEGADVGKSYEEFAQRMGLHAANKPKAAPKATPAPRPKASRPVTAVRPATQLRANEYTNVFVDRLRGENVTYKGEYKDAHPGVTDIVAAPKTNEQEYEEFISNIETPEQREYEDTRRTLKALRQKGDKKGLEETRKAALSTNPGKSKFGDARAVLMDELYHPNGMLDVENNEQDKRFAETQLARTYEHETGEKLDFSKVQFTPEALKEFQEEYNSKDWVYDGKVKGEGGVSVSTFTPVDNADDIMYASKAEKKLDAAALNTSIDSLSNEISQYLGELEKSIDAKHNDLKWWQQFGRNTQQDYTANGRLTDPEWVSAVMAGDALKNSQQILREADIYTRNGGKRSLSNNFVSGAFRGLVDKGFDIRTWDMGVSDALEASQLNTALQKADKGQQLTKGEQMLLDAKATELAVNYCVGDSVGRGYKAGSVTAESIPFMLEMAVNPSAAAGKSAQAMMVRYMLKRFSKKMVKNQAKKMFAAKLAGRIGGDIVGAYGMSATTGAIRTGADAINRMSGELKPGQIGDDGHIRYAGHKEGETSVVKAVAKAGTANAIQNVSEFQGEYFSVLGKYLSPFLGRVAGKVASTKVGQMLAGAGQKLGVNAAARFVEKVGQTEFAKKINEFQKATHWDGTFGEYAEEVLGNIENAIFVGDMDFSTEEGKGVFNLSDNIDTYLGVSLMGGAFGMANVAGYAAQPYVQPYIQRKRLNTAERYASHLFSADEWRAVSQMVTMGTNTAQAYVQLATSGKYTTEQLRAALQYAGAFQAYVGSQMAQAKRETSNDKKDKQVSQVGESYDNGRNTREPDAMADAKTAYEEQRKKTVKELSAEFVDMVDRAADPFSVITQGEKGDAHAEQTLMDYLKAKATYEGVLDNAIDIADDKRSEIESQIQRRTSKTSGKVEQVFLLADKDKPENERKKYYVSSGTIAVDENRKILDSASSKTIVLVDEDGTPTMVSSKDILEAPQVADTQQLIDEAMAKVDAELEQTAAAIDGKVNLTNGSQFEILGEDGKVHNVVIEERQNAAEQGQQPTTTAFAIIDGNEVQIDDEVADRLQRGSDELRKKRVAERNAQESEENPEAQSEEQNPNMESEEQAPASADVQSEGQTVATQSATPAEPHYEDRVTLRDAEGNEVQGFVNNVADNKVEVVTDQGQVLRMPMDEFQGQLQRMERDGESVWERPAESPAATEDVAPAPESEQTESPAATEQVAETESAPEEERTETEEQPQGEASALERIPETDNGPAFTSVDAETAWDGLVEYFGSPANAQEYAQVMVEDSRKRLDKAQKAKPKHTTNPAEFRAAQQQKEADIAAAQTALDKWTDIANEQTRRENEVKAAERHAAAERRSKEEAERKARAEAEKRQRAEAEEAARKEREAIEGVPDWSQDTPDNARARGFRRAGGYKYDRQQPIVAKQGKETEVKFADKVKQKGHAVVIDAGRLQPSHVNGRLNVLHFIPEAQPKARTDAASVAAADKMAAGINPEEITSMVTAYTGAPTVNSRGEVIQGNNRSAALKTMWQSHKEQGEKYKQYLQDHAEEFGLNAGDIARMENPVLVNMLDVDDARAIELGQYTASDTESGGTERIKAQNAVQKMGEDMKTFAAVLLSSSDEEASFSQLIDKNGVEVLQWMAQKGYITPTQYKSAFDTKGNLTAEAANDLKGIMYQSIFQGGSTQLEVMFNRMPAKAQRAILATAYRDYDSPQSERMIDEIQKSIMAFNELMSDPAFAEAKNFEEARRAIELWKMQYQFDDATGESYLPTEKYSNFALHLAAMYKGCTQSFIQSTFSRMYDIVQGVQQADLFNQDTLDNTPRTLAEAIKEVLNIDYDGQARSNALAGNRPASEGRKRGSSGDTSAGERGESGEEAANGGRGLVPSDNERGGQGNLQDSTRRQQDTSSAQTYKIKPIGESDFGFVYDQFRGDAQGAIQQLIKIQSGEAIAALHYVGIGDIDLVWGYEGTGNSDGYGLAKLVKYHPEVLKDLQGLLDSMHITKASANRIQLENDEYQAAVRLTWNGNDKTWLLTAFKKRETPEPTNSRTDVDSNLNGKSDDTATRQSEDVSSADKVTQTPDSTQQNGQNNSSNGQENTESARNNEQGSRESTRKDNTPATEESDSGRANEGDTLLQGDEARATAADADSSEEREARKAENIAAETLNKGEKWANTGAPEKFKSGKRRDSHDVTWYIGKKKYGSTTAERDLLEALTDQYGNYTNVWNAYERGEFTLNENEAAILKALLEAGLNHYDSRKLALRGEAESANRTMPEGRTRRTLPESTRKAVEAIARYLGVKSVVWEETLPDENGFLDADGTLHIAMDAENPLDAVFGHEATHQVKRLNQKAYRSLESAVRAYLGQRGFDAEVEHKRWLYNEVNGMKLSDADLREEVVADIVGRMLHDNRMAEQLVSQLAASEETHGVLSTIRKVLHDMAEWFRQLGMDSYERTARQLERTIGEAFAEARKVAGNDPSMGQSQGGKNFKVRENIDIQQRAEEVRTMPSVPIVKHNKTKEEIRDFYYAIGTVTNEADGKTATFYHGVFGKMWRGEDSMFSKIAPQLKELYEKSLYAFSEKENLGGTLRPDGTIHKEHRNIETYDYYISKANIDGKNYYVRFTVQSEKGGQRGTHDVMVTDVQIYDNPISDASDSTMHGARLVTNGITDTKVRKFFDMAQSAAENNAPKLSLRDCVTYFSGGGLVEAGLSGDVDPKAAVEYERKAAGVYRNNFGDHIVVADVRDIDPKELIKDIDGEVGYFHASPVCKNFSKAKTNGEETPIDMATAQSTATFIDKVLPRVVTIENVKGYRGSEAMKTITDALDRNGYTWDANVYNAADFGGYTNRERLIVRAVREGELPPVPQPTGRPKGGWMDVVGDIIDTLPEKKNGVAPWMDERLKKDGIDYRNISKPLYVFGQGNPDGKVSHAFADELLPTLRTKSGDVIVMPDGRVLKATGRVLARISGLPDSYQLPDGESLAHSVIGNGVPTQLTKGVIAPLVNQVVEAQGGERKSSKRGSQLNPDTPIRIVEGEKEHGFKNFDEAKEWAKTHIARTYNNEETGGKGEIRISNTAIGKYLSESSVGKSESKDVHLSVLKVLPDVIRESVDVEQYIDRKKGKDGTRNKRNGENEDVMMHRLYGAVNIDGKLYRVKITLKDYVHDVNEPTKAYSYEATKIELSAGQNEKTAENSEPFSLNSDNSISAANLLQGVEKSYEPGKKLLDESENSSSETDSEEHKSLVGIHNITEEKLRKAIKQGGLANPSLAVIDTDTQTHDGYGEISLIAPYSLVAKSTGRNAGTWMGDAWTPSYPQVELQMNEEGSKQAAKDIQSVPDEMQGKVRMGINNWLDGRGVYGGLNYLFLYERGEAPEVQRYPAKFSEQTRKAVSEAAQQTTDFTQLSEEGRQVIVEAYIREKYNGDREAYVAGLTNWRDNYLSIALQSENERVRQRGEMDLELFNRYGANVRELGRFVSEVKQDNRMAGTADADRTIAAAERYVDEHHLQKEIDRWAEDVLSERYGVKEVIFNGYTPSGNRRYIPNTLANVSAYMKKQGLAGAEGMTGSFGAFAAKVMQSHGALSDIRKNKGKLTNDHKSLEEFRDKWSKVFIELGEKCQPDATSALDDYGMERLSEAATKRNPVAYLSREYGVELSKEDAAKLSELIKAIREDYPSMYFETKFERPVEFGEFSAAVVPENASTDVVDALKSHGMNVFTYNAKDSTSRKKAVQQATETGGIRFSLRQGNAGNLPPTERALRDVIIAHLRKSGVQVIDDEEGQRVMDMVNSEARLQAKLSNLAKAANTIKRWLENGTRGKSFTIELPEATQRMIHRVMGRDFDSHNITANGVAHANRNHGENGQKLVPNSIPLRKEDLELIPYIMTAPDYIRRGSEDVTGRTSVRFYKELSNGYVVVAEKEYKNSPDDMETITMWAEMSSSEATNARRNAPDTHVRNAILSTEDIAKIRQDAENAIAKDGKLRAHRVFHGSAADFTAFDHKYMGTGEGAQAYGWGTYLTEVEGIGRMYADNIAGKPTYQGKEFGDEDIDPAPEAVLWTMAEEPDASVEEAIQHTIETLEDGIAEDDIIEQVRELNPADFKRGGERHLYTVEIPEDNGSNYFDWMKMYTLADIKEIVARSNGKYRVEDFDVEGYFKREPEASLAGDYIVGTMIEMAFGPKGTSDVLAECGFVGIKYPAQFRSGGRKDEAKNYVIFNEADAKVVDHVRFFRTPDGGEAYGFTVGGKIYIDPRIAKADTPIHEYSHGWTTMLQQSDPKLWQEFVRSMKRQTAVWDYVQQLYPDLKTDDELADEVFAHFSGKRGAERLRQLQREALQGKGSIFDKAARVGAWEEVKQMVKRLWRAVMDNFGIKHTRSAEEFADMTLRDLARGRNVFSEAESEHKEGQTETEAADGIRYSLREKPAPKKTQKVYKLMRLGEDGKLYPLFIDAAAPTELGKWYDADSPNLDGLRNLPSGIHLIDNETGEATPYEDFFADHKELFNKGKMTKFPSKEAIAWATDNGARFVYIEDTPNAQRRFEGENRRYWNLGINGSGSVSTFSMRPGWHAGSLPTMRQIGKGAEKNLRDDRFVWVEGEVSADIDYNEEASHNPDHDMPDRIPTDGFYMKATNANKKAAQADRVGWYVAGSFKADRIISDSEARAVIDEWNAAHPDKKVDYDWERESGKDFDAETMSLVEKKGDADGIKYSHRSGQSEFAKRRDESNNNVDRAVAFVTGRTVQEARAERRQKEEERRQEAKDLYDAVLSGNFDDVTLQRINDYIETSTPNNPYGRRISQRIPQRMESKLLTSQRNNAVDALFSRISESAVPPARRKLEEGRREIAEKKKELLKKWAIATGNWHTDISDFTNDKEPIGSGKDSDVYTSKDGKNVIKFSKGKQDEKRFPTDIDAVTLYNNVFRNTPYTILGYGKKDGKFVTILQQPAIDFKNQEPLTEEERIDFMHSLGYNPINKEKTAFSNGQFIIADVQRGNIVKDSQGNIRVIDADVKLHTPEYGGAYKYPPVEEDLPKGPKTGEETEMQNPPLPAENISESDTPATSGILNPDTPTNKKFSLRTKDSNGKPMDVDISTAMAREAYERRMRSGWFQSQEALQDSMLSLEKGMLEILRAEGSPIRHIEDIDGFENPYLGENRMSSVNADESEQMAKHYFEPLWSIIKRMTRNGNKKEYQALIDYVFLKHAPERNQVLARRDAEKLFADYQKKHPNGTKTLNDFISECRAKDYSGLTAMFAESQTPAMQQLRSDIERLQADMGRAVQANDVQAMTALHAQIIQAKCDLVLEQEREAMAESAYYEADHDDTDVLWDRINAANQAVLRKTYESGMMSKETYDKVRQMFTHYVPLRGFEDTTAEEAYAYVGHSESTFNAPIKTAKGRTSKSDDPFATMEAMADSAIMQGNRNRLVAQPMLFFARNHPSDLVSVSELWIQYDAVNDEWKPAMPNIGPNDSPADVDAKMRKFEQDMEQLSQQNPDEHKRASQASGIPYRVVSSRDLNQHQVLVKLFGKDYILTVNGNPRMAQALSGLSNPDSQRSKLDNAVFSLLQGAQRLRSKFATQRNLDFSGGNFVRDMIYANTMVWVKETPLYATLFHINALRSNPLTTMPRLIALDNMGRLDLNDPTQRLYNEFMRNGGDTGFLALRGLDERKKAISQLLKTYNGRRIYDPRLAFDLLGKVFDYVNACAENSTRFAAYRTSRQMGRSIERSIWDAKEISVNFNKKGAGGRYFGENGQTLMGNAAAATSYFGRTFYMFWNAAVQGTFGNFMKNAKRHPVKAATAIVLPQFALGFLMAALGYGGDGDDDKNRYADLTVQKRRQNICFKFNDQYITIPLSAEFRPFYGMGELAASSIYGAEMSDGELAMQSAEQFSQMLPLDLLEGSGGLDALKPSFIAPALEVYENKSWTGLPIWKENQFNESMPDYTKAYKNANKQLVGASKWLNEHTKNEDGIYGDEFTPGGVNINPAKVEYLLNSYFSGYVRFINEAIKTKETVTGERDFNWSSIPMANRFAATPDERTRGRAVTEDYYQLRKEMEQTAQRLKGYKEKRREDEAYETKYRDLKNTDNPTYRRYKVVKKYADKIDDETQKMKKYTEGTERYETHKQRRSELQRRCVEEVRSLEQ